MGQCDRPNAVFAIFQTSPDLESVILRIDLVQTRPGAAMTAVINLLITAWGMVSRGSRERVHPKILKRKKTGPFLSWFLPIPYRQG